jgi:hypothetical protein
MCNMLSVMCTMCHIFFWGLGYVVWFVCSSNYEHT